MYWGNLKKSPKKASWVRFYKVCILTSPILTGSARYPKLKTFFFRDDTHFSQFSKLPSISKCILGPKRKQKSEPKERRHFSEKNAIFFSPNKTQNMAILRWSWRGSTNSKKYMLQLICVKKILILAHTCVRNEVFVLFVHFPEVQIFFWISL